MKQQTGEFPIEYERTLNKYIHQKDSELHVVYIWFWIQEMPFKFTSWDISLSLVALMLGVIIILNVIFLNKWF